MYTYTGSQEEQLCLTLQNEYCVRVYMDTYYIYGSLGGNWLEEAGKQQGNKLGHKKLSEINLLECYKPSPSPHHAQGDISP